MLDLAFRSRRDGAFQIRQREPGPWGRALLIVSIDHSRRQASCQDVVGEKVPGSSFLPDALRARGLSPTAWEKRSLVGATRHTLECVRRDLRFKFAG